MSMLYDSKEQCSGCTACVHICPQKAIKMEADIEGFLYPVIDIKLCNNCGKCKLVCAFNEKYEKSANLSNPIIYAAKHKDNHIRSTSSSGGMFVALSDYILSIGGVIYGVRFGNNFYVYHDRIETSEDRDKFKGSKYVQSDLTDIFIKVKDDLLSDKIVLFSGTPCQTAGLKSYLNAKNVNHENLHLCDLVCHGTPSPLIWKEHIKLLERKNKSNVVRYDFRSKVNGGGILQYIVFSNGKRDFNSILSQVWMRLFLAFLILRPACHNCKFTNFIRPSDITIADYWGIDKCMPEFDDGNGVSLVIVNTQKGEQLFNNIRHTINYEASNQKDCKQDNLEHPSPIPPNRKTFWHDYYNKGYEFALKNNTNYNAFGYVKNIIKMLLIKANMLNKILRLVRR